MTDTNTDSHLLLNLRTQVVTIKADRFWDAVFVPKKFPVPETALLVSDVRDRHWCNGAEERCAALAEWIGPAVSEARSNGVQVIHAPTGTMDFYEGSRQRRRIADAPPAEPPDTLDLPIRRRYPSTTLTMPAIRTRPSRSQSGPASTRQSTSPTKTWSPTTASRSTGSWPHRA